MSDQLFIGMLSGTSRDGVDAVLVNCSDNTMDMLHASCTPYPAAIKLTLDQLMETGQAPDAALASLLDENLARFFARVAQNLVREAGMEMRDVHAIGSHGQNVWHRPWGENPVSLQLGKGALMAKNTGTTVVNNFRNADLAAGGQGAPLAPLLHRNMFHSHNENRAVLNIGGIANLTILPAKGDIAGFDCGPGNCLMDAWTKHHLNKDYDNNGNWARKGNVKTGLLGHLLDDPYFKLPAPKSTGLEYFNMPWLNEALKGSSPAPADVQATLAELTAKSIANSLDGFVAPSRLLVCGGGAQNEFLMRRLAAVLPDVIVETTARFGADPDWVEGLLFAWLAKQRLEEKQQDTSLITGSDHAVLLGEVHQPPVAKQR
jgi:anhydro-N-acetylmuramic acid kinase